MAHKKVKLRSFNFLLLATVITACLPAQSQAQTDAPKFESYPVTTTFTGKTARPVLKGKARRYRTLLSEAAREKPNFAGQYIVATWGCGSGCVEGAVIDAKTGAVFIIPFTLCCWGIDVDDNFEPVRFKPDSRLVVFSGARNENERDNGEHYYKFENGRLVHIRSVLKSSSAPKSLSSAEAKADSPAATREIKGDAVLLKRKDRL